MCPSAHTFCNFGSCYDYINRSSNKEANKVWSIFQDVTILHPLTPTGLTSSASNPRQTLITAFNNKFRHTLEACSDEGIVFVPVCQESLGGYHERSASVLKRIALAQSRAKGTDETETIKYFFQKLSIILQKGNCSLLISCVPHSKYAPPPHWMGGCKPFS